MKPIRYKLIISTLALLLAIPLVSAGCGQKQEMVQAPTPATAVDLSSTQVPDTPLDLYVYVKQASPTTLPEEVLNAPLPVNVAVESLAVWGVASDSGVTFAGGVTLTNASVAVAAQAFLASVQDIWTTVSGSTIYFVRGSGSAAETLKTAISNKRFKNYDDKTALEELASFPDGGTTKRAATGIVTPSKTLINYMARLAAPESVDTVNTVMSLVNLQVVLGGLYTPEQVDLAKISAAVGAGGMWDFAGGVLGLVKSGLPGFIVSPAAKIALGKAGFVETNAGGLTLYKSSFDVEGGRQIPVLARIEGNRLFVAASADESYAQTLLTSIKK